MESDPGHADSKEDDTQKSKLYASDDEDKLSEKSSLISFEGNKLTLLQSATILLSLSYGSAVVIIPNTLVQIGPVTALSMSFIVVLMIGYCTYLNNHSIEYALQQPTCSNDVVREPYPTIAEIAGGPMFRKLVAVMVYVALGTSALGFVLLSATMMNNAFPFKDIEKFNSVRIWTSIICLLMTPLMFYGTFVDIAGAAVFAVFSSSVSLVAVLANCFLLRFGYNVEIAPKAEDPDTLVEKIFITFGLFTFAAGGPSAVVPNVSVFVQEPKKFPHTIAGVFGILVVLYAVAGSIPYGIFGDAVAESVEGTFNQFHELDFFIQMLTTICDITMSLHLLLEAILAMNPVYLHIESTLGVPIQMNWKRIVVRTLGIMLIYSFCIALPRFRAVLSVIGAIPITLVGVIFPIIIHSMIFENGTWTTLLHSLIFFFFLAFMAGNLIFSVQQFSDYFWKNEDRHLNNTSH